MRIIGLRMTQLTGLAVFLALAACASATPPLNITPLPCSDLPPAISTARNETAPRPREFHFTNMGKSAASIYMLVEPSGAVNPDSIMICGVQSDAVKKKAAEATAKSVFHPALRDGVPIRKWTYMTFKPGRR